MLTSWRCRFEVLFALTFVGCSGAAFSTGSEGGAGFDAAGSGGASNGGHVAEGGRATVPQGSPYIVPASGAGGAVGAGGVASAGASAAGAASAGAASGGASLAGGAGSGGSTCGQDLDCQPVFEYAAVNATAQRGNSTSTPSVLDECPPGSVLVGVNAEVNQGIVARLQGVCGVPTIRTNQPGGVFIEAGETLPLEGNVDGTPVTRSCPDGAVIVGFEGRSGQLLDQLRLHCARLLVADGTIVFGTLQPLEPIGESGGMPFQRAACPEGALATGTNASVDEWISSFGMPCASVTLEWQPP